MKLRTWMAVALAGMLLAGCNTAPKKDLALERVRVELEQLKADEELAGFAQTPGAVCKWVGGLLTGCPTPQR